MLSTVSAFIRFHGELEDEIKEFYESLAVIDKYSAGKEAFLALSKENKKHKDMILRTYREVISDAFEAAFPLTSLDEKDYEINVEFMENLSHNDILKIAIEIEGKSYKFCEDASESINGLIFEVSQAFISVKKWKEKRRQKLINLPARGFLEPSP